MLNSLLFQPRFQLKINILLLDLDHVPVLVARRVANVGANAETGRVHGYVKVEIEFGVEINVHVEIVLDLSVHHPNPNLAQEQNSHYAKSKCTEETARYSRLHHRFFFYFRKCVKMSNCLVKISFFFY